MNKLFTKIAVSLLSVGMAVGVGVAVGHNDARSARADGDKISTLTFTSGCGGSGKADDNATWTVTSDAAESTYDATKGIHYGTGNVAVSYLQLSTSDISGTISKIVVNASGAKNQSPKINVTVGGSAFGSQQTASDTAKNYTFEGSASGTIVVRISQTSAKKALYCKSVVVTYSEESSEPEKKVVATGLTIKDGTTVIDPEEIYYAPSNPVIPGSLQLKAEVSYLEDDTHEPGEGNVTWESKTPSVATIDENSGLVTFVSRGETVITATAEDKGANEETIKVEFILDITEASFAHGFAEDDPFTVAEAIAAASSTVQQNAYAEGYISLVEKFNSDYSSITYWLSDTGTHTSGSVLQIYSGKGLNGADFSSKDDLEVGQKVLVKGDLKLYTKNNVTTPEFDKNSQIISLKSKVASIELDPTSITIESDDLTAHEIMVVVDPESLINPTLSIASSGDDVVDVDVDHIIGSDIFHITGKGVTSGTEVITVSANDGSNKSATLTVTAHDASEPILIGFEVTTNPTKLVQYEGNAFDGTGMVIEPVYDKENTNPMTVTINDFTWSTLKAGETIVGTYKLDSSMTIELTAVEVRANTLTVTLSGTMAKTSYTQLDEAWDTTGLTVSGQYADGTAYAGEFTWTFDPATPAAALAAGEDTLTILVEAKTAGKESDMMEVPVSVREARVVSYAITDELDNAYTGVTGTSYADWDNDAPKSSAHYCGQSAGSNESIQLRSKNSNSGIVSTVSGGNVRKIKVTWESNTSSGNSLDIYGSDTAYTNPTDLYGNNKGTKLGSIVKGTSTELTIEGDYKFVGLRSYNGALYITKIEITWDILPSDTNVELADNFVKNFMHMGHIKDDGSCTAWYEETKAEFAALCKASEEAKNIILLSNSFYDEEVGDTVEGVRYTYADVRARLSEWARINGETFTTDGEFTKGSNRIGNMFNSMTSSTGVVITVISLLTVSTLGAYFLLKKRKEQ